MASAPLPGPTVWLHVGAPPPPSSSGKITLSAALLEFAECQKAKWAVSVTVSTTFGATGLRMSMMIPPSPMQAPAAMPLAG